MNLFFKLCRAETILGGHRLEREDHDHDAARRDPEEASPALWVGGNIGISLLEKLPEIGPDDLVALELSSFQLENLGVLPRSPHIGVVLNISPNHLDRHDNDGELHRRQAAIVATMRPKSSTGTIHVRSFRGVGGRNSFYSA
jgi:UDP-N-acetylmuramoylalanine--D-glutamate ligase